MRCAVKKTIRTNTQCTNEGVVKSPYSGNLICEICADEIDYLTIKLNKLRRKLGRPESEDKPLINYQERN